MPIKKKTTDVFEIVAIVDRSGSMVSCVDDAEGGFNAFLDEQREQPGKALLTLAEFDDYYDLLTDGEDIKKTGKYTMKPRGMTALLDALGRTLTKVAHRHEAEGFDGKTVVVVVTDGMENASREWTRGRVKNLISDLKEKGWEFVFLAAKEDAIQEGVTLGVHTYDTSKFDYATTYSVASRGMSAMRSMGGTMQQNVATSSSALTGQEWQAVNDGEDVEN